jgi:hypothetical protein
VAVEARELRPGLWRWTAPHPDWRESDVWPREVGSVYAELPDAVLLVDPLVPADDADAASFWRHLDGDVQRIGRPVVVALTVHWHERTSAEVAARYGGTLWRPEEDPTPLPDGVEAEVIDGSDWKEAALWLEPYRALVLGDLMVGEAGGVRIPYEWFPQAEREWARTTLREELAQRLLARPAELVLVAHGEPVLSDGQAALRRALSNSV